MKDKMWGVKTKVVPVVVAALGLITTEIERQPSHHCGGHFH